MTETDFKNARTLKENLSQVLYSLQHLKVDGVDLAKKLKVSDQVQMSAQGELREDVTNLRTALALSEALVTMTESIKTPRNSGVSGSIYQADQNQKKKKQNAKVKLNR